MRVKFYGTRGSFPVSKIEVTTFGGNTSCISIETASGQQIVIDSGSGIRNYGADLLASNKSKEVFILYTHFHMDHVQGLPFFMPAYDKSYTIHLASLQADKGPLQVKQMIDTMMSPQFCPVTFDMLHADFHIHTLDVVEELIQGIKIETIELSHPGGAGGIKITDKDGASIVVMVDNELTNSIDNRYVKFCQGVDVLVHDAQYTDQEYEKTKNWGHSTFNQVLKLGQDAQVKKLIMTHHDPDHNDDFLQQQETDCQSKLAHAWLAKDGLEIEI